jgi:hypothetical protein
MTVSDDDSDVSSDSPVIFSDEPSNDSLNSSVANNDTNGDDSDDSDSDNDDDRLFEDQEHPPEYYLAEAENPKIFGRGKFDVTGCAFSPSDSP